MNFTLKTQWLARLKLLEESEKLRAESEKLFAESDKLWEEGNKLWEEAILELHGNITLKWKWRESILDCHLENGEVYLGDMDIKE